MQRREDVVVRRVCVVGDDLVVGVLVVPQRLLDVARPRAGDEVLERLVVVPPAEVQHDLAHCPAGQPRGLRGIGVLGESDECVPGADDAPLDGCEVAAWRGPCRVSAMLRSIHDEWQINEEL